VAEAPTVGEREPDRGERRLGVVGVDVDDRELSPGPNRSAFVS
jgi:hypothetical protein